MEKHQCLLLLMPNGAADNLQKVSCSDNNYIKACVLLPTFVTRNCPQVLQLFTRHNIEVINNRKCLSLPLQHALKIDQVEIVELHVNDLNQTGTSDSKTANFCISVVTGNEPVIRHLFGRDAAVRTDTLFPYGVTRAVDKDSSQTMRQLLTFRADISVRCHLADTLLHLAVLNNDVTLVKLLLKHNAKVNVKTITSSTPLHFAAEDGDFTIVDILLETGAEINARRQDGSTSLLLAVRQGETKMARLLIQKGANVNIGKYDGLTPLHLAVRDGNGKIVDTLLEHGATVNAEMTYCCTEGVTPLYFAIDSGNSKLVERLLKCGTPLINKTIKTALYESVCRDGEMYDKIVKLLFQYGFFIDVECTSDLTFFHKAISKNYSNIVQLLVDHGTNVNKLYCYYDTQDREFIKTTPLLTAIKFSEECIVKLLLERGADVNAVPYLERPSSFPLNLAIRNGKRKIVELLLANGADVYHYDGCPNAEDLLYLAIEHNWLELVGELLNKGFHVDGNSHHFSTPINYAAQKSSREMIELLFNNGASVDSRDGRGQTALHSASLGNGNRLDIVKFLIQNNADIDARCFSDRATPILVAVSKGRLKIVDELLKCGATIDATDDKGGSPFIYAVTEGHNKIFRALLDYNFTERELIQKMNICQIFSTSYLASLRNDKRLKWLYECFCENEIYFEKCVEILARHVIKTEAAFLNRSSSGSLIESDNETLMVILRESTIFLPFWYEEDDLRNQFISDCEAEIAKLKTEYIGTTSVSFYDILTKDVQQIACYARNASIRQTQNAKNYRTKFPIYSSIISYQFRKGTRRRNLLNRAIKTFSLLSSLFKQLPHNLKEEVFKYLGNKHLEVLIYACTQTVAELS